MSYSPVIGFGSKLEIDDGASNAYAPLVAPVTLSAPWGESATVDISHMAMATRDRQFAFGLHDSGTITGEMLYNKADWNRLNALKLVTGKHFRVTAPDDGNTGGAQTWTAAVLLTKVETSLENENVVKTTFEAKITGAITPANAS